MSKHDEKSVAAERTAEHDNNDKTIFGFWVYLMTDCILFASLFAVFAVMRPNTFGGPSGQELFNLPFVFTETILLLASSFTCGMAMVALRNRNRREVFGWLLYTMMLGLAFLGMEVSEFHKLAQEGNSWTRSGFLSAFFVLVGTHGLHISVGLLWLTVLLIRFYKKGFTAVTNRRFMLFSLFWHFLDLIWIFIFTIVYLMGAIPV